MTKHETKLFILSPSLSLPIFIFIIKTCVLSHYSTLWCILGNNENSPMYNIAVLLIGLRIQNCFGKFSTDDQTEPWGWCSRPFIVLTGSLDIRPSSSVRFFFLQSTNLNINRHLFSVILYICLVKNIPAVVTIC